MDDFGRFEKMEDPEERKAPDLIRKESSKKSRKTARVGSTSVSANTAHWVTNIAVLVFWLIFLSIVAYGVLKVLGAYTNG